MSAPANSVFQTVVASEQFAIHYESRRTEDTKLMRMAVSESQSCSCSRTGSSNPSPSSRQSVSRRISPSSIARPAVAAAWAGPARRHGRQRRAGSSTSRQLPATSLSGSIPVPQCRLGALQPGCTGAPREIGLAMRPSSEFGPAQGKPSTVRCSCQPSGRRECASSLSAVRSGG